MFTTNPFYFSLTKKYTALFGTMFNNIYIERTNASESRNQLIRVPLTYGPKEKMLARLNEDPNIDKPAAIVLPAMAFEMTGINYNPTRKLQTTNRISKVNTADTKKYQYNPVPYDINFTLTVYATNSSDIFKITEQILPFFTPNFTVSTIVIPEIDERKDIITVLNGISTEENYEGSFKNRQTFIWTLQFTMYCYYYGPVTSIPVIKFANSVFYVPTVEDLSTAVGNTDPITWVQVRPGLDANGQPTSNSSLTVDASQIDAEDDYGYIVTITESDISA